MLSLLREREGAGSSALARFTPPKCSEIALGSRRTARKRLAYAGIPLKPLVRTVARTSVVWLELAQNERHQPADEQQQRQYEATGTASRTAASDDRVLGTARVTVVNRV